MYTEPHRDIKVKIIQGLTTGYLEKEVNSFIEALPYDPIDISFGSSSIRFEGEREKHPLHIAYIKYRQPREWR